MPRDPLDELRDRFPGHMIDRQVGWDRGYRFVAYTRDLATKPTCVISQNLDEIAAELAAGAAQTGPES